MFGKKKKNDRATVPEKVLQPVFGHSCRTATFLQRGDGIRQDRYIHLEASLADPVQKTWVVSKVTLEAENYISAEKQRISIVKSDLNFKQTLDVLSAFEKECSTDKKLTPSATKTADTLGAAHYRNFAECEGYLFDTNGLAHARPAPDSMPAIEATFDQKDINHANKNLQRPAEEFNNAGPLSKAPNTYFLFDQFTRAAQKQNVDTALREARIMALLDTFTAHISKLDECLKTYCGTYLEAGQSALVTQAEDSLTMATTTLRQIKGYGIETKELDNFLLQCEVTCHTLHAEGLYGLMRHNEGDFDANETAFKDTLAKALAALHRLDVSDTHSQLLERVIVQTPAPEVPASIAVFVTRYKAQRSNFLSRTAKLPPSKIP